MNRSYLIPALALGALAAMPVLAQTPYVKPDESWITISGTVKSPAAETFTLDYGTGSITVEMDDWDWYGEANRLRDGDKVTVYGEIDDDLYELASIEADSVYVEGMNTYFFANDADEESVFDYTVPASIVVAATVVNGTVNSINGREFTLDTGNQQLTVNTAQMAANPLDDEGLLQIEEGDLVSVSGTVDPGFFERRELDADAVVRLQQDKTKKSGAS